MKKNEFNFNYDKNIKKILIVPAYNEEKNILKTYQNIVNYNKINNTNYDILVINDGSHDNTELVLVENKIPHIQLIHNLGIGGAVQTGYKYAYENNYDIAVQFDGDGQHDIKYVEDIINPIINNEVDMVIGSRFIEEKSKFKSTKIRQCGINIISFVIKIFTGKKIYDTTSGFRACNRKIIENFSNNYPMEYPEPVSTVSLLKQRYKIAEIPVEMNERTAGKSSIRTWKSVYYMINVILSIFIISLRRYK